MLALQTLLTDMVKNIVDDESAVVVTASESDSGTLLEVRVGVKDVGKVIGKQGRIASSLRTVVRAAAAKRGLRVMVNVFNKSSEEEA